MIVDSSAVIAVLTREGGHESLVAHLASGAPVRVGAPTLAETGVVLVNRLGVSGRTLLARLVQEIPLEVVAFEDEHVAVALDAFRRYGKGRHPASLNFGDCMAFAVALVAREPLLCVGNDLAQTDLELVA